MAIKLTIQEIFSKKIAEYNQSGNISERIIIYDENTAIRIFWGKKESLTNVGVAMWHYDIINIDKKMIRPSRYLSQSL